MTANVSRLYRALLILMAFLYAVSLSAFSYAFFGGSLGLFLLFSGPFLLISALFYADWRLHKPKPSLPSEDAV